MKNFDVPDYKKINIYYIAIRSIMCMMPIHCVEGRLCSCFLHVATQARHWETHETALGTCRVCFRVLTKHLAASSGDQQGRLDAKKVHSHLFEELDPREENLHPLVLLPQLIKASAQGAHLRRSTEGHLVICH